MDDLAAVEVNTPENMLDKLSTALQVVKEVCEENALTLNVTAGKTEAIVLIREDKAKEVKRRRVQPFWRRRRARSEWWTATVIWAAVSTAPVPRTRN